MSAPSFKLQLRRNYPRVCCSSKWPAAGKVRAARSPAVRNDTKGDACELRTSFARRPSEHKRFGDAVGVQHHPVSRWLQPAPVTTIRLQAGNKKTQIVWRLAYKGLTLADA